MVTFTHIFAKPLARPRVNHLLAGGMLGAQVVQLFLLPVWVSPLTPWCGILALSAAPSASPVGR